MVHWWLVGGCCRLLVGWSICRSSQGPSFRAGQRQGNGRATPGGQRRGWGGARAQIINQVRHHVSHGWINFSRLNLLTPSLVSFRIVIPLPTTPPPSFICSSRVLSSRFLPFLESRRRESEKYLRAARFLSFLFLFIVKKLIKPEKRPGSGSIPSK